MTRRPCGTVMYADDGSDEAVMGARSYIKEQGLTRKDCKLVQRGEQTLVILERDIEQKAHKK